MSALPPKLAPSKRAQHLGLRQLCCRFSKPACWRACRWTSIKVKWLRTRSSAVASQTSPTLTAAGLPPKSGRSLPQSKALRALILSLLCFAQPALAGTSANYTLAPDTLDNGGLRGTSASYSLNPSLAAGLHGTSSSYALRTGFAGQLADAIATALDITASPLTVNETGTRQLGGTLIFDDLSTAPLLATDITWSVLSGPITGINASGLATAAAVYQDTSTVVHGTYQALSGTLNLTVLNTLPDNFGAYAADAIDDDWQVLYFGLPPNANASPAADPDFDGQDNFFEFTAGVLPNNALSRFLIHAASVPGQPTHKNVIFSPRFADRTYSMQTSTQLLTPSWTPLTGFTLTDNGNTRTVTDTNAAAPRKFYRVQITKP